MISPYIDNMLDEKAKEEFLQHVDNCSDCSRELEQMRQLVSLLSSLPEEDLPENFRSRLREKLEDSVAQKRTVFDIELFRNKYVRIASAIAACLVVAFATRIFLWKDSFIAPSKPEKHVADDAGDIGALSAVEKEEVAAEEQGVGILALSPPEDNTVTESPALQETAQASQVPESDTSPTGTFSVAIQGSSTAKQAFHINADEKDNSRAGGTPVVDAAEEKAAEKAEDEIMEEAEKEAEETDEDETEEEAGQETGDAAGEDDRAEDEEGLRHVYQSQCDISVFSMNPLSEVVALKNRADLYGLRITGQSPGDVIDVATGNKDADEDYNPDRIVITGLAQQQGFDGFVAALKVYYPQADISIGNIDIIDRSAEYEELKNKINEIENRIKSITDSDLPEKEELMAMLEQQLSQYCEELEYMEENSEFIHLTITIKRKN